MESSTDRFVVADFEAGIGTLTRMDAGDVDTVVVVLEPTAKSLEVGIRATELAREKRLGDVIVVVNRVREDGDLDAARERLPDGTELVAVPYDVAVVEADREGVSPLDHAPDAPAVRALTELAERLAAHLET